MTGEMHESEVTRETYPTYFAIADEIGGTVRPFDHYQGPYILTAKGHRLWVCMEDDSPFAVVYNERTDSKSEPFYAEDIEAAKDAANSVVEQTPNETRN